MILYFTGTGNSWAAAKRIARENEKVVNITDALKKKACRFNIEEGERVGFVFPVYFGGLPLPVHQIIRHIEFSNRIGYSFGVATYGGFAANACGMLKKELYDRGILLSGMFDLNMPENYCMMYQTPEEGEILKDLEEADEELDKIIRRIEAEEYSKDKNIAAAALTKAMYPMYVKGRDTKGFYTDERCVGCGVCASRCPVGAIKMEDGRPKWVKEKCAMCMACVRCNAIQYKDKLADKRRYVNPEFKKASSHKH